MDVSTISASVGAVVEIAGLLIKERDRQKAAAIQIDFTDKVIQLQTQVLEVMETVINQQRRIAALEQRERELLASAAEKERYELTKLGMEGQFFAYRERGAGEGEQGGGQAVAFFCQPCFEGGKKFALNDNGDGYVWCPVCKHGAQVAPESDWRARRGRDVGVGGFP